MKKSFEIKNDWQICDFSPFEAASPELLDEMSRFEEDENRGWIPAQMPAQVHDILLQAGRIRDPALSGTAGECLWVAEKDWVYRVRFSDDRQGERVFLHFKGLDTLVDIYLNGRHIAYHNDMFLPERVEVTGMLQLVNSLVLHFHSPHEYIRNHPLPAEWQATMRPFRVIRKDDNDFTDYLGAMPYFTRMGVYDLILLESFDSGSLEIGEADLTIQLQDPYTCGRIRVRASGIGNAAGAVLDLTVRDPHGRIMGAASASITAAASEAASADIWAQELEVTVDHPELWWPRGFGEHPLYEAVVSVTIGDGLADAVTRHVGFRDIRMDGGFDCRVNGRRITLWGAQPAHVSGMTHCWDNEKSNRILDLAENCNMNAQRIWGASDRYDDEYYNETDRRGILVWQEFFHNYGMYPDTTAYRDLCRREAEFQVQRLKHHPSLLFWCGGNECFMGAEFVHPGVPYIGGEIFLEDYPEVCTRLDPDRYYHPNSPWGGEFTNDPQHGDTHSYTNTWYVPGADYPVMVAEEIRTSPPALKSLARYIGEDRLWPAGYTGLLTKDAPCPWPDSWNDKTTTQGWAKIPPIEQFYDGDDAASMVYRFGAAHGNYLRGILENNRRGKPSEAPDGERTCKGHFVCRWNDSWPIIYGSMLDYFVEPYIPYYAIKRAFEHVLISFDIQNFIYVWVVNDSARDIQGTLHIQLFDMNKNQVFARLERPVSVAACESRLITNLDEFRQFDRSMVLFAYLTDENGVLITRTDDFADIERHLRFPEAELAMAVADGVITMSTDRFARCVELAGDENGDAFGWVFEDNYFDLLPGEVKTVRILGRHKRGVITAKPYYSKHISEAEF